MKAVRQEDTEPEQAVRKLLWDVGARYRLNVTDLPGSPDIANKSREKVVFVHGCFWHYHEDCERGAIPDRNQSYWRSKFRKNRERDRRKNARLREEGFDVLVVWECELDDPEGLRERLADFWFDSSS